MICCKNEACHNSEASTASVTGNKSVDKCVQVHLKGKSELPWDILINNHVTRIYTATRHHILWMAEEKFVKLVNAKFRQHFHQTSK